MLEYEMQATVWVSPGKGGWHFVTLPQDVTAEIRAITAGLSRPWGSLRVEARLGLTRWQTSIFPDTKAGAYLLPVKGDVRAREGVGTGDQVALVIGFPDLAR